MTHSILKVVIDKDLKKQFSETCKAKGYTMSERIKEFVREEIKK